MEATGIDLYLEQPRARPSLQTLSPELLLSIFSYLKFRDCRRLLTTSKYLYPLVKESLWSTVGFTRVGCSKCRGCADCGGYKVGYDNYPSEFEENEEEEEEEEEEKEEVKGLKYTFTSPQKWKKETESHYLRRDEWRRLIKAMKDEDLGNSDDYDSRFGWKYTKNLILQGVTITYEADLVEMLVGLIETGKLRPQYIYVDTRSYKEGAPRKPIRPSPDPAPQTSLLSSLKSYSTTTTTTTPSNLSFGLRFHLHLFFPFQSFPSPHLFTTLNLCIPLTRTEPNVLTRQIKQLSNFLSAMTTNLQTLILNCSVNNHLFNERYVYIEDIEEQLSSLQHTFRNHHLSGLKKLTLISRLFHTKFFLIPPVGVRALRFEEWEGGIGWYRQFSQCGFGGKLEYLELGVSEEAGYFDDDDDDDDEGLDITSFACNSLRYFGLTSKGAYDLLPTGLVEAILESNKQLNPRCVQRIVGYGNKG
ncbi:hypothetical protein TWF106_010363 [Orbilia oligospora]|uniref:F-box domain-containing protein n=1 Tax=Orbilia oligospora TaxID=2813651 RepID=A0A7C8UIX1_ORBOL|nr:hypothetical protein TWF106_010363 [Orbilia oligospora]